MKLAALLNYLSFSSAQEVLTHCIYIYNMVWALSFHSMYSNCISSIALFGSYTICYYNNVNLLACSVVVYCRISKASH